MHKLKARYFLLLPLVLILVVPFLTNFSFGAGPAIVQNNLFDQVATTAITSTFPSAVTSGNLLVIQITINQTSSGSTHFTVFDNESDPLTQVNSVNSTGLPWAFTSIYYMVAESTEPLRFELNTSSNAGLGIFIWEVSGVVNPQTLSSTGTGGGCGCSINPAITAPSNSI